MFGYQFQYPQAFWLLLLVPFFILIYFFYRLWRRRAVRRIGDVKLVRSMMPSWSAPKHLFKFCLLALAFGLGCITLANPRKPDANSGEQRRGIDIVIALDVSNSMKAADIAPNRLDRAKQFISRLIDNLQDDRMALVVFAGNAYAQMPLTFDREAARLYVNSSDPSQITAQGTSIGDAFVKSDLLFGEETQRFRSVVLITDGETHDENALDEAKKLAAKGVMINTIGIGSSEGSAILDSSGNQKTDENGQPVISRLNEKTLQDIASLTNGKYIHLQNSESAVKEVMDQYSGIEKKALGDTSLYTYNSFYAWLAAPMLFLLLLEIFLPDRKKIKS